MPPDKKKILIICTNSDESGAPRHVEQLIYGLNDSFEFTFLCGTPVGPVYERLKSRGLPVYVDRNLVSKLDLFGDLALIASTTRLVKKLKPDLLHLHSSKAGLVGRVVGFLTATPVVYTIHGWPWRGFSSLKRKIIWLVEYFLAFFPVTKYILVSGELIEDARSLGIRSTNSDVVHNCVPDIPFELIAKHGFERPLRIIMPARVTEAKDHETLICALRDVSFQFELILCGLGTETESFQAFLRSIVPTKMAQVICLGERSDVAQLMASCDLFVLCSHFEAFPVSVVEALRAGLPVLATDVGGLKEAIDSKVGALVRKRDVDGWKRSLDEHKELAVLASKGREARARFQSCFTLSQMTIKVSKIYSDGI